MGEPLKRAENSFCVIAIHSMSDGPSNPSRGRNAPSDDGVANEFPRAVREPGSRGAGESSSN